MLAKNAPSININNFTALTRLDQNRMASQLKERLKVDTDRIHNGIIWGNHSATQYPDIDHSYIDNGLFKLPTKTLVGDDKWIEGDFTKTIQQRVSKAI
jgi:malate/lactate dehydrogenase